MFNTNALAGFTNAEIIGFGSAPRILPLHVLRRLSVGAGRPNGRIDVEHDFAQDRVAPSKRQ